MGRLLEQMLRVGEMGPAMVWKWVSPSAPEFALWSLLGIKANVGACGAACDPQRALVYPPAGQEVEGRLVGPRIDRPAGWMSPRESMAR